MSESAFSAAKRHSIYKIANTPIRRYPFPHLYVEDVFPDDFYDQMQRRMLDDSSYMRLVDTGRVGPNYDPARLCLFPEHVGAGTDENDDRRFWAQLFATYNSPDFINLWTSLFLGEIKARVAAGDLPEGVTAPNIATRSEVFLMRDGATYQLLPHTDSRRKAVSVLFYMPRDTKQLGAGTALYLPKKTGLTSNGLEHLPREEFDLVATMPYRPNSLFAFPRLENSFHGVEASDATRRDIMLFDIKFVPTP